MSTELPPPLPRATFQRRNAVTLKLLFIAGLVLLLELPLHLVNNLRQERFDNRAHGGNVNVSGPSHDDRRIQVALPTAAFDGYRMVERALKHSMLVLTLVFAAFFLFEVLAGLRLHAVHYGLVGAALCLFYLALLALGEVVSPGYAYIGAAVTSSLLIVLYSGSILRRWLRATSIAALLATVHSVLFVVLQMEFYALLAGTAALFVALAGVMFFTRNIDWQAHEAGVTPTAP